MKIQDTFLILALVFGIIYAIITPPFQSVDENTHFYRAYAVSGLEFTAHNNNGKIGGYLPISLLQFEHRFDKLIKNINAQTSIEELQSASKINLNPTKKSFVEYTNTALYSPVPYIAQSIGIGIGNICHLNPFYLVYLGRLFNVILYCILGYFTIQSLPYLKSAAFLILLMPMNISLAGSLSTDVTVIGLSLLWCAKIFQYTFSKNEIKLSQTVLLSLIAVLLALSKHYLLLLPLVFIIPKNKFRSYVPAMFLIVLLPILACALWQIQINNLLVPLNSEASLTKQWEFIVSNPLNYINVLLMTILVKTFRVIITMVGVLGWQDTRLDIMTYLLYPFAIGYAVFKESAKNFYLSLSQRCWLGITFCFGVVVIITYMYLSWTPVGNNIVIGLNGKYFTPLLLPLLFLFLKDKKSSISPTMLSGFSILVLFSGMFSILIRFYNIFPYLYYKV